MLCVYPVGMSGFRRTSKGTDPLLRTYHWTKVIRPWWQRPANRRPCARCGGEIDWAAKRYLPGTKRVNPASLVVGHIVGRDEAKAKGWTDSQINALSNTQPEHARCSDVSGAVYGNRKQMRMVPQSGKPPTDTSRRW